MHTALWGGVVALTAALLTCGPAAAIIVGGGGSKSTDCLLTFSADANFPVGSEKQVRCVDGDPSCDTDMTVNGVCSLRVAVCANSTYNAGECSFSGLASVIVEHAIDTPTDPKFDPDFQALQNRINNDFSFPVTGADTCTGTVIIGVNIKGPFGSNNACGRQKKKIKLRALSTSGPQGTTEDKDTLKLYCDPAPPCDPQMPGCDPAVMNGCNPQILFGSTFDRMQKQIFNQSCALSGCHDSNSQSGGLLLESGAAYTNLVNHAPANPSALGAGWLRVDPGSTDTSFLFHKIEGTLPDSNYGLRMPRNRPKLNGTLRDIIEKWINAGAPASGWVPGTD